MAERCSDSERAAEQVARSAYGRLLAFLSARTGDVAAAEDALAEAFASALQTWPSRGVPDVPQAWLLQVARRKLTDAARRAQTRKTHEPELVRVIEEAAMAQTPEAIADDRLALLFTCAHPAIDPAVRTPLMLQTVLGLDAARIASVFLVSQQAMAQRLVRAKAKIKAAGIPFAIPEPADWAGRLDAVLNAVYGAYTAGWDGHGSAGADLKSEAEWLARLLCELIPGHAEAHALVALILYCESRGPARAGAYTPLSDQDTALWDEDLIEQAEQALRQSSKLGPPARFQFEAAIQSIHAERRRTRTTNWLALLTIYDALVACHPTLGGRVARSAVLLRVQGPTDALAALDQIPSTRVDTYAPYWATRAHVLSASGNQKAASGAYDKAIALTTDPAVTEYLEGQRDRLNAG